MQPYTFKHLPAKTEFKTSNDLFRRFLVGASTSKPGNILQAGRTRMRTRLGRLGGGDWNDSRLRLNSHKNSSRRLSENPIFQSVSGHLGASSLSSFSCSAASADAKYRLRSTTFTLPISALRRPFSGATCAYSTSSVKSFDDIDETEVIEQAWTRLFQGMIPLKPDLKENGGLPSLPPIESDDLRAQVFTHRSLYARSRHDFEDEAGDPAPDNEVLEFQGDAVLGLVVADLVREMYPNLRVGPTTKIRSLVVGNATLADISVKYGLHQKTRFQRSQSLTLRASPNIQADTFEAYVGGLYTEQGLDVVKAWAKTLFTPYVEEAYNICREQHLTMPSPPPSPTPREASSAPKVVDESSSGSLSNSINGNNGNNSTGVGHLSFLNQYLDQQKLKREWKYESIHEDREKGRITSVWRANLLVQGKTIAKGKGVTKKIAQNEAARDALKEMGVAVPAE